MAVRTDDGAELAGLVLPARLPRPPRAGARPLTFVVAHGFTNSVARAPFLRLAGWLAPFGEVRALDFRGHGRSGGGSGTGGDPEMRDVDAAVAAARADGADAVVTLGLSMGGGAVLRQAALGRHRPDAVVSVSAVSRWYVRDTRPMRRVHWLLETTLGRRLGARAVRLRLGEPWLTAAAVPAAGGQRDRTHAAAARARRPGRVLPARALPRAGPGGRSERPPRGWSRASDTPRAAPPLRSSSGSDAGLLRRSTREFPCPGVRAAGPGAPPARRRAAPRSPSRCWSSCPSCSATWAGWPPCSCCSWAWCSPGCWSPASRGSPGSLAVGAAAAVAADLVLVLPARPAHGRAAGRLRRRLPRRGAPADVPPAPHRPGRLAGRHGAAARRRSARWRPSCCSAAPTPGTAGRWSRCSRSARRWSSGTWSTSCCPGRSWPTACPRGLLGLVAVGRWPARR